MFRSLALDIEPRFRAEIREQRTVPYDLELVDLINICLTQTARASPHPTGLANHFRFRNRQSFNSGVGGGGGC